MTWQVHFYNERSRVLARYGVQAPTPAEALVQARRIGGQDLDGWTLYRIVKESR